MEAVVITGVSTGIGYATAKLFTSVGYTVFGSVRSDGTAQQLENELGPNFKALLFDVTNEAEVHQAAHQVRIALQGQKLAGLINNAGCAYVGVLPFIPINTFRKQLEVNLVGQLIVTQAFLPLLGTNTTYSGPPGKIINISSVSGTRAYPFMSPYAVSKHALEGLSEGLRRELMPYGIDVIIVGPGAIKTPIWDKAREQPIPVEMRSTIYEKPAQRFSDYMLKLADKSGLPAEDVAKLLLRIMRCKHPKVRYAPMPNKWQNFLMGLLPKRWLDRMIARRIGLIK